MKRWLFIASLILAGARSATVIAADSYLPVIEVAPSFALTNVDGSRVTAARLRGSVLLLTFMYTHCSGACPLVTERIKKLADRLQDEHVLGQNVKLVSISFDPARDTPRWLKTYSEAVGVNSNTWMFLSGTPDETALLLKRYDFEARRQPTGDYDHVSRVYLIDTAGRIRQIYSLPFLDEGLVLQDVKSLIPDTKSGKQNSLAQSTSGP